MGMQVGGPVFTEWVALLAALFLLANRVLSSNRADFLDKEINATEDIANELVQVSASCKLRFRATSLPNYILVLTFGRCQLDRC